MAEDIYEQAGCEAAKALGLPQDVRNSDFHLSVPEKIKKLSRWEYDLSCHIVASGEGMRPPNHGRAAEALQKVQAALRQLRPR